MPMDDLASAPCDLRYGLLEASGAFSEEAQSAGGGPELQPGCQGRRQGSVLLKMKFLA